MATHRFICKPCSQKFSIESDEQNVNTMAKSIKVRCPKCDKIWGEIGSDISHDFIPATRLKKFDKVKMGKENHERSLIAVKQAAEFSASHSEEMVTLQRPKGMQASRYNQASERIPKKVIDAIKEKVISNE